MLILQVPRIRRYSATFHRNALRRKADRQTGFYKQTSGVLLSLAILLGVAAPALAQVHLRPPPDALQIYQTLELQPGATVDFADIKQTEVGPLRGYVYVRFQGELVVIPVYRPEPDGTIWRARAPQP